MLSASSIYQPLIIRFGAWTERSVVSPNEVVSRFLRENRSNNTILDKIIPIEGSLWYHAKSRMLNVTAEQLVLFFDQFEELFSYPEPQVQDFQKQMAELLRARLPQRYEQMLEVMALQDNKLLTEEEELRILKPLRIKAVIAIRSDRMHLLDRLSSYLPAILRNNYELRALSPESAREAILLPAAELGDFISPPFSYTELAMNQILNFLKDDVGRVEGIQLQILCQAFEEKVSREFLNELDIQDIGNLKQIIAHYYHDKIASVGSKFEQLAARRLIEEGLVLEEEQQRLTLHEGQITALFRVPPGLLQKLVDSHLLRMEPAPRGGYTYELSHDTLVNPVLESKQKRRDEEKRVAEAKALKAQMQRLEEEERKRRSAWLFATFAGTLALLALAALLWALRQKKNAEVAEEKALISQTESDQRREEAEKEKERADGLSITATLQRDSARQASKRASQEKRRADRQALRAQLALIDVKRTSSLIVDNLIEDAVAEIFRLDYETALEKLYDATKMHVREKSADITDQLLEMAYVFAESGKFDRAWNILDSTLNLSESHSLSSLSGIDTLNWFRNQINRFKPERFAELERRYYPQMVKVKGGIFCLGLLDGDCDTSKYSLVTVNDFLIARTETTAWQFSLFVEATGYQMEKPTWGKSGNNPVVNVSWYDAVAYANWLSKQRSLKTIYGLDSIPQDPNDLNKEEIDWNLLPNWSANGFRLPTEIEWEYASRGGIMQDSFKYSGSDSLGLVGWYNGNSDNVFGVYRTHPVGEKLPNSLGIFDMSGNVLEWCWGWSEAYPTGEINAFVNLESGLYRILRGGSWGDDNYFCGVLTRSGDVPDLRRDAYGFRVSQSLRYSN